MEVMFNINFAGNTIKFIYFLDFKSGLEILFLRIKYIYLINLGRDLMRKKRL